jgi:hypothetical protein
MRFLDLLRRMVRDCTSFTVAQLMRLMLTNQVGTTAAIPDTHRTVRVQYQLV